ncbi:MAG: hypothetical protein ABIH37_05475 [archaeon]
MPSKLYPTEPCPKIASDQFEPVDEVNLDIEPIGTLIRFQGSHPDSRYIIQIIEEREKRYTRLWFKDRPGCFCSPSSHWKNQRFNLEVKVGRGYTVPHFHYDDSGLMEKGLSEPRAEGFKRISTYRPTTE